MNRFFATLLVILALAAFLSGIAVGLETLLRDALITEDQKDTIFVVCLVSLTITFFAYLLEDAGFNDRE